MRAPKPFGIPAWTNVRSRLAKKILKEYGLTIERLQSMEGIGPGDLICTCEGLNSRIVEIIPDYVLTKKGRVIVDFSVRTETNYCSFVHCGVRAPISYEEAVRYKQYLLERYKENDAWGFAESYAQYKILPDGSYTREDSEQ